jgi:hypothetical protein
LDDLVEGIGRGVNVRLQQFPVDGDALGRNFEMVASARLDKFLDISGDASFTHVPTK